MLMSPSGARGAECDLSRLAERRERFLVRPFDELGQVGLRKAGDFDNRDPAKAPPVSGRLDAGMIRQLDKPVRRNLRAETPTLRSAGLEVGERLAADGID